VASGRVLTYPELIARGAGADWMTLEELEALERQGIEWVENTPAEIVDLVTEMHHRLDGTWQETEEDRRLQARFAAMYPDFGHDRSCFPGRYGALFLRANAALFEKKP
jgi:putative glycosyltransferase (TIGR04372 family)